MSEHGQLRRDASSGNRATERSSSRAISRRARAALPISAAGAGMVTREVSVAPSDVVFVKGVVEASDGLASVFAERGGELTLAAPHGREAELAELLSDLEAEIGARIGAPAAGGVAWAEARQDR